jgi:D-alanyl-D-alanine dipeptidase
MALIRIAPPEFDVAIGLAYATENNFTGRPVYRADAEAWLHPDAAAALGRAIVLARELGLRIHIFDAFRPQAAQWALWNHHPDPEFVADPRLGSMHARGVAVDLTLLDGSGRALEMGTPFDDFTAASRHASTAIGVEAQRNRFLLLGLMSAAGWDFNRSEWWHYQLFDAATKYTPIDDAESPVAVVAAVEAPLIRSGMPGRS